MRRSFLSGVSWRAFSTIQWAKGGTFRTPDADSAYPIKLEAPVRNGQFTNAQSFPTVDPVLVGEWNDSDVASSTVHNFTLPVETQVGDLLIAFIANEGLTGVTVTNPTGWTVISNFHSAGRGTIAYKVATSTDTPSSLVTYLTTGSGPCVSFTLAIRGGEFTTAPEKVNMANGLTPPSATPSWSAYAGTLYIDFCKQQKTTPPDTITAASTKYTLGSTQPSCLNDAATDTIIVAYQTRNAGAGTETPDALTSSGAGIGYATGTVMVRGKTRGPLAVLTNYRVVQPNTFANAQTFYGPTVSVAAGGSTKVAPLHTNSQTFFGPRIVRTLKPAAQTNAQAYFTQTIRVTLKPALLTNSQSFFGSAIRRTLKPGLFANSTTFTTQTIRVTLKPTLFTDGDTFYSPTMRRVLQPSALTNSSTFQTPKINRTLKPSALANSQSFGAATVSVASANKSPALFANASTFYGPTIRATIKPAAYSNSSTIQSAKLVLTLKPTALTNVSSFYAPKILAALKPSAFGNAQAFQSPRIIRTLKPALLANAQTFFGPRIVLQIKPAAYANSTTYQSPKIIRTLKPATLANSASFGSHTVSVAGAFKQPPLHTNASTFASPRIVVTLKPIALSNTQSIGATRIVRTLRPAVLANAQSFFAPKLLIRLSPSAYANGQTINSQRLVRTLKPATLANGSVYQSATLRIVKVLAPAVFVNSSVFQASKLRMTLKPAALSNAAAVFGPQLQLAQPLLLTPQTLVNVQGFTGPLVFAVGVSLLADAERWCAVAGSKSWGGDPEPQSWRAPGESLVWQSIEEPQTWTVPPDQRVVN